MLKSNLCDYSDSYKLVTARIIITRGPGSATDANKQLYKKNKGVTFKLYVSFNDCIWETNKTSR